MSDNEQSGRQGLEQSAGVAADAAALPPSGLSRSASQAEPAAANAHESFADLQARQQALFEGQAKEIERLKEALTTVRVNAMRSTPKTRAALVSFCDMGLREVLAGSTLAEALRLWEDYTKCSSCGAAAAMLANGLCFECAPEGQWPCSAQGAV